MVQASFSENENRFEALLVVDEIGAKQKREHEQFDVDIVSVFQIWNVRRNIAPSELSPCVSRIIISTESSFGSGIGVFQIQMPGM